MNGGVERLRTIQLTKTFPGVVAVDKVDFDVRAGEIHALVGENGAGKSTLIKILGGVYPSDGGQVVMDGREVVFTSTHESLASGISVIYQEFNLVPDLTVAENIFIGREPKTAAGALIDFRRLNARAAEVLATLDMPLDVKSYVSDLSVAQRQMVEIAKALSHESRLIIMDEPTATLTEKEVRKIFEIVKNLRERGVSLIYISHRLEEAFELADRISVMRDGRKVGTKAVAETSKAEVIEMMVGKVVKDYFAQAAAIGQPHAPLLEVRNYSVADAVEDVSFTLEKGEILAIAGILGSGVHGLLHSLFGVVPKKAGEVFFEGRKVEISRPRDAIRLGIGYVTEDRKNAGLLPAMSVLHNLTIIIIRMITLLWGLFIRDGEETRRFDEIRRRLDIKLAGPGQRIIYLSGGNHTLDNRDISARLGVDVNRDYEVEDVMAIADRMPDAAAAEELERINASCAKQRIGDDKIRYSVKLALAVRKLAADND